MVYIHESLFIQKGYINKIETVGRYDQQSIDYCWSKEIFCRTMKVRQQHGESSPAEGRLLRNHVCSQKLDLNPKEQD